MNFVAYWLAIKKVELIEGITLTDMIKIECKYLFAI